MADSAPLILFTTLDVVAARRLTADFIALSVPGNDSIPVRQPQLHGSGPFAGTYRGARGGGLPFAGATCFVALLEALALVHRVGVGGVGTLTLALSQRERESEVETRG